MSVSETSVDDGSRAGRPPAAAHAGDRAEQIAWLAQAAGVLRRDRPDITADDVLDVLARRTDEGLQIPVLGLPGPGGRDPLAVRVGGWDIRSLIVAPDRGRAGVVRDLVDQELAGGATSIWLRWPGASPAVDLRAVPLDRGPVILDCDDITGAAQVLAAAVADRRTVLAADAVGGVDPFAASVRAGAAAAVPDLAEVRRVVIEIAAVAEGLGIRALAVDGSAAHDAGAGDAAELGWMLAVAVELLRMFESSGRSAAQVFGLLEMRLAATVQQYPTLAKMRAARLLWARLAEVSGVPDARLRLHAVTSRAMLTRHDPETNQLRTTVAAFAAGAGGADAVTVLPYDAARGVPSRSPRRWARAVSLLLQAESHVSRLSDPAAGAFALEDLTDRLAADAWAEFQRIEAAGGAAAALADGSVRRRWQTTAAERRRRIAHREQAVIGVSVHPPAPVTRSASDVATVGDGATAWGWSGIRSWAEEVETLQDDPTAAAVFVAPLGSVAAHQSAVGFALDVLASGGVRAVLASAPPGGAEAGDLVREFVDSGCPVVCLAGRAEPAAATELVQALRAAGARWIVAAAGSAPDAGGVDDRIDRGDDVLDFARRIREQVDPAGRAVEVRPAEGKGS